MNNREAFDFLKSKTSVREASIEFMTRFTWEQWRSQGGATGANAPDLVDSAPAPAPGPELLFAPGPAPGSYLFFATGRHRVELPP